MRRFNCIERPDSVLMRALILVLFGILSVSSPAAVLRGVVCLNELEGPAVSNVSVTADGAQPAVTESDGRFDLVFPNKRPGDLVEIVLTTAARFARGLGRGSEHGGTLAGVVVAHFCPEPLLERSSGTVLAAH
jgi:hypothetical protein